MGNGRHSGLPRGVRDTTDRNKPWTDNMRVKSYASMSNEDAANYYKGVRLSYEDSTKFGLNFGQKFQALVHDLGLHDKPIVLTDADYDRQMKTEALDGIELYRGVTNKAAVESLMFSDYTYEGDGIHGDGLYFSTQQRTAIEYGKNRMTAYIDKTLARPVTESTLRSMLRNESHEVQWAFSGDSGLSAYAIKKGYNVIHVPGGNSGEYRSIAKRGKTSGEDYYVPLVRNVLVFREHSRIN